MAESILVTGKKISSMELVTNVTGNEKIPTGQPDDLAVTPNQIADHTIARGDLASQEDLSQVEVSLGTQITDLESNLASGLAAEEAARIAADNLKVDKEGSVSSVAGRVGDVVLAPSDVLVEGFGSQEDVNKYIPKPFLSGYTYGLGERVVMNGGEVVKSLVDGNVSDPNVSMVGWVSVVSDSLATTVQTFNTPEAGVDPVTGVADGAYFNVRSAEDDTMLVEYQNVGSVPTPTGKRYLSGAALNNIPASKIKDASGKTQQQINDGLESVDELRNTNPTRNGLRVYVKSWHAGLGLGDGDFISTQSSSLADNGVTVFRSLNPQIFWVRTDVQEVTPFMAGAKGDRIADDQPAFMAALATNLPVRVKVAPRGYRLNATVTIDAGQVLVGDEKRVNVYVDHEDACFLVIRNATLKNFEPRPLNDTRRYTYDGVVVGITGTTATYLGNNIDNIAPFYPRNAFVLRGMVYWNTFTNISCYLFRDNGILLSDDGYGKNNNYFQFKQISSNAPLVGGSYDFDAVTWEQCAIRVSGTQNIFIGGENAPSKWGVWVDGPSTGNRFFSMYGEAQQYPIKTFAGSENYYESMCTAGTPQIHPDSIVHGQGGKDSTRFTRLGIAPIAAQKGLKALWFFNEGKGAKVLDHSGNKKHLGLTNPVWSDNGRWGKTVELDAGRSAYIDPIPSGTIDWTQPFTFAACVRITEAERANPLLAFRTGSGGYSVLYALNTRWFFADWTASEYTTEGDNKMLGSPQDGYSWVVVYFDPINKTLTNLDTERGVKLIENVRYVAWEEGISSVCLGYRTGTVGLGGSLSFVGLWQRRLNMAEVADMVNMKVPNLFPSAAPVRIDDQADNTINLTTASTTEDIISAINQIAVENNELRDKMRGAGIML